MNINKGDKKNIILERRKPKTPQRENPTEVDGRDTFQTPNYATDIIVPFLEDIAYALRPFRIWECASGLGKMSRRLQQYGYHVAETDLTGGVNFLSSPISFPFECITTNPPFSLKRKFFMKCVEYDVPFALLIPADYSSWLIEAIDKYGCEKVIPTRRIDYITPNIIRRIWEGEAWEKWGIKTCALKEWKESHTIYELQNMLDTAMEFKFDSIYDAPAELLKKYSSSYYHSMWLTRYFNIGKTETFVELTNEQKMNI